MLDKTIIFIFGALLGSFLNVCIFRLPKGMSIITPFSFCPHCKLGINWYDNIPLVSYVMLRGRCRNCRERISLRYPLVELITAALFLILYRNLGWGRELLQYTFLFSLLIVVSFIDIEYHAIPAYLCLLGIIGGLIFTIGPSLKLLGYPVDNFEIIPAVKAGKGLIFGLGFAYLFKFCGDIFIDIYLKIRRKESIEGEKECLGLGDVDFMGMVGTFLGANAVILVFFLAPFLAVLYSLAALIFKKTHLIPYLPYLSVATIVVFFWGPDILRFIF